MEDSRRKGNGQDQKQAAALLKSHLSDVKEERIEKLKQDQQARKYPAETWSVGIDSMQDQFFPHFTRMPKSLYENIIFSLTLFLDGEKKDQP